MRKAEGLSVGVFRNGALRWRPLQGAQGFSKKIYVQLLAAHQSLKFRDARACLGECSALVLLRLQRFELARPGFGSALAVQPFRPMGLPRLDPIMKEFP